MSILSGNTGEKEMALGMGSLPYANGYSSHRKGMVLAAFQWDHGKSYQATFWTRWVH